MSKKPIAPKNDKKFNLLKGPKKYKDSFQFSERTAQQEDRGSGMSVS